MYSEQLARAVMLHKALVFILDKVVETETDYPDFQAVLSLAADGLARNIRTECEHAPNGCLITTVAGGIAEILALLEDVIEELTLEVDFGEVTMRQAFLDTEGGDDGETGETPEA